MGKFSESNYNILDEYFGSIIEENTGTDNSYLIGPKTTIFMKGGVVTHLYEKRSTGEFVGHKFRIISINDNQFKFTYEGLITNEWVDNEGNIQNYNSLSTGTITTGNEVWFRKDSFFRDWLYTNRAYYRDYVNINKSYNYFGKIYAVPEEENTYSVTYEGMKDYMLRALPENNKTDKLQEFLNIYFDKVHHSVYNLTKNLWSMIDPKEIDIRFLNYIASNYGIEIDEDLEESKIRDWVDSIIYFLKRKGSYASIFIVFKLMLSGTSNKLNIYERWDEWYRSRLGDTPLFENDHHAVEFYGLIPSGGAGPDYYSQYTGYPTYTDEAPSGDDIKNVVNCGVKENYFTFNGVDSNNNLTIANRVKLNIDDFDRSSNNLYLSKSYNTSAGDFYHCVKTMMSSASSSEAGLVVWGLGNESNLLSNLTSNWLSVELNYESDVMNFKITEGYNNGGSTQNSSSTETYSTNTDYYLGIERNSGDLNLHVFDDSERSNLLETVSLTLNTSASSYTYLYALNTYTTVGAGSWTGNVYDLSTAAVTATDIANKGHLILTPHYKVELDLSSEPIGDDFIINEHLIDELIRNWEYNKPVSKFVHYEQLIAPTAKMDAIGENVSLYDETKNAYLSTQFTGSFFLSGATTSEGSLTYSYNKTIASSEWIITHNLNSEDIVVQTYDENSNLMIYNRVVINDRNKITIYFDNSVKGNAYIVAVRPNYDYIHTDLNTYDPPNIIVNYDSETVESDIVSGGTCVYVDDNLIPHIAYYDFNSNKLKYAKKESNVWIKEEIVDIDASTSVKPSITLDSNGYVHISYNNSTDELYYITNKSGSWVNFEVSTDALVGYSQIVIDSIDIPHIIYCGNDVSNNGYMKHSKKSGGLWINETFDTLIGGLFTYVSATVDSSNTLHVSYVDTVNSQIKYAYGYYHAWTLSNIENDNAYSLTMVLDNSDNVHITYASSNSNYKHITNMSGSWVKYTIDVNTTSNSTSASMFDGNNYSLVIDSSNVLHTIYKDDTNNAIKYAKFDINNWSGWQNTIIESIVQDSIILDHEQFGFHITKDYLDNIYGTYNDYEEGFYADLKYLTLSSYSSGASATYWDINHSLETSGASGTVAQFYNSEYYPVSMMPSGHILTDGDNMRIAWESSDAYGGKACIRRADYHWVSVFDSDSVSWDFLNTVDGWTSSDDVTLTTTPSSMIITPDSWIAYESGWIERSLDG